MYAPLDKPPIDEIYHFGIKGMKWGHRPSDPDTSDNTHHTTSGERTSITQLDQNYAKARSRLNKACINKDGTAAGRELEACIQANKKRHDVAKKVAIGVGVAALAVGAGYLAYRNRDHIKDAYMKMLSSVEKNKPLAKANPEFWEAYLQNPHMAKPLLDSDIESMKTDRLVISPGEALHRMQWSPEKGYKKDGFVDRIFCSYEEDDVVRYRGLIQDFMMRPKTDTMYELTLRVNKEIKSPSQKERFEIFRDLVGKDADFRKNLAFALGVFDYDTDTFARNYYNAFAGVWCAKHELVDKYLQAVKDAGFNAIIDDNDAGHLAEAPLILLDSNTITYESVETVGREAINEARAKAKAVLHGAKWSEAMIDAVFV